MLRWYFEHKREQRQLRRRMAALLARTGKVRKGSYYNPTPAPRLRTIFPPFFR
jgi:hypothetical protein